MRQAEKEKKILVPNSIYTRPEQENSQKNRKKIQKFKKLLSDIICSENGMRQAEKEKKKFQSPILFILDPRNKIQKKKQKKKSQKIKKPLSGIKFSQNGQIGRKRKKNLVPNSIHTRPGKENSEKNSKKIQKIVKPLPGIILAKTG